MPEEKYFNAISELITGKRWECKCGKVNNPKEKNCIYCNRHKAQVHLASKATQLTPEYIAFVEWLVPNLYEEVLKYQDHGNWQLEIDGDYFPFTTQQLFIYFMEKVYKK